MKLVSIPQAIFSANATVVDTVAEDTLVYLATAVGAHVILRCDDTLDTITIALPGAPTSFSVDATGTSMALTFSAPADTGNLPVLSYDARWSDDEADWTIVTGVSSGGSITGLPGSTLVYVQVAAVTAAGRGAWTTSASDTTGSASWPATGMVSDTFDTQVSTGVWTKGGHSNATMTWGSGGYALLGSTNSSTYYGSDAPRMTQACADVDFQVTIDFQSLVGDVAYQFHGIYVEEDANDWTQVYVEREAAGYVAQRTDCVAGTTTDIGAVSVTQADSAFMRLSRVGDDFTFETSQDGSSWTARLSWTRAMTVSRVGICAGTAGSGPTLAVQIDSFTTAA